MLHEHNETEIYMTKITRNYFNHALVYFHNWLIYQSNLHGNFDNLINKKLCIQHELYTKISESS